MSTSPTRRDVLAAAAAAASAAVGGCVGTPSAGSASTAEVGSTTTRSTRSPTDETTVDPSARERLDETLVELVEASDRAAFAADHGLTLEDGRVLVVAELREGASLPESPPVDVEARHGSLVQGFVAVDDLPALSTSEGVAFVRPPNEPSKHGAVARSGDAADGRDDAAVREAVD